MKGIDDLNAIGKDLKRKLSQLQSVTNSAFVGLTPEMQNKLKGEHVDLNKAIKAAQSGNIKELTNLANKYNADTN
jgi:hypothetical protein